MRRFVQIRRLRSAQVVCWRHFVLLLLLLPFPQHLVDHLLRLSLLARLAMLRVSLLLLLLPRGRLIRRSTEMDAPDRHVLTSLLLGHGVRGRPPIPPFLFGETRLLLLLLLLLIFLLLLLLRLELLLLLLLILLLFELLSQLCCRYIITSFWVWCYL